MIRLTITGSVPSKKNSRVIVRSTGRSFPNPIYVKWEKNALKELASQAHVQGLQAVSKYPVRVVCKFYVKDRVQRDIDNMLASIMDVLKTHKRKGEVLRQGILDDDNWMHVNPLVGEVVGVDKLNPRVEIEITS